MRSRLLAFVLLLTACGIPLDSGPRPVPVDLPVPGGFEEAIGVELEPVTVFLVRDDQLVGVTRNVRAPARLVDVIEALVAGATDAEERSGLRTSIPAGTALIDVRREGPIAVIDLSADFAAVGGAQEILAVAQFVITTTQIEGIESVSFELQGVRTDVPITDGALSVEPVTAADYADLVDR
jgi:spore germination protein GerM